MALVDLCSGNQKRKKLVDTDCLADAPTNGDELEMDVRKGSGAKDTSGTFQWKSSHFSSSTKNTFIQHGLQYMFFQPKNHLLNN